MHVRIVVVFCKILRSIRIRFTIILDNFKTDKVKLCLLFGYLWAKLGKHLSNIWTICDVKFCSSGDGNVLNGNGPTVMTHRALFSYLFWRLSSSHGSYCNMYNTLDPLSRL